MEVLKIESLKKKFANQLILDDVSFVINEGDAVSVIGPSGAGKSTLLKIIFNLTKANDGNISVYGDYILKNGTFVSSKELKKIYKQIGLIFQDFNLFSNMTVYENISLAQKIVLKKSQIEIEEKTNEVLEQLGLSEKKDSYPSQLSGGQCQRVAIARALAMNPKILLLDEPTSALDIETIHELEKVISFLKEKGITLLMVTHDIKFAEAVSNRVIMLVDGKITVDKKLEELDSPLEELFNINKG